MKVLFAGSTFFSFLSLHNKRWLSLLNLVEVLASTDLPSRTSLGACWKPGRSTAALPRDDTWEQVLLDLHLVLQQFKTVPSSFAAPLLATSRRQFWQRHHLNFGTSKGGRKDVCSSDSVWSPSKENG